MSKTILITGTSSGIGKATAHFFHSKGWNVIATMRSPEKETELTELDNVLVTRLDVQDHDSILNAVKVGIEHFGGIDVLLNNAGYGAFGTLESTPREKIIRQYEVNVFGVYDTMKAVIPHFRYKKNGIIINISSVGGKVTFPFGSLYHGTKFAVEGITESLRYELAECGIAVKLIEPGGVKTDFGGRSIDTSIDPSMEEYNGLAQRVVSRSESGNSSSEPEAIAEVIYTAATDGKDMLRYIAGDDAKDLLQKRKQMDDDEFGEMMDKRYS